MIDDESDRGTVSDIPDDLQRDSVNSVLNSKNMYRYKEKGSGIGSKPTDALRRQLGQQNAAALEQIQDRNDEDDSMEAISNNDQTMTRTPEYFDAIQT